MAVRVDPWLHARTGGRVSVPVGLPVAMLTTRGARSGMERTTPVVYFNDGDDVVLVASSFGRERNPAWYHNLRANPDATLAARGRSGRYRAVEVEGDERERLYAIAERFFGAYGRYRERAAHRTIPVLRLTPCGLT